MLDRAGESSASFQAIVPLLILLGHNGLETQYLGAKLIRFDSGHRLYTYAENLYYLLLIFWKNTILSTERTIFNKSLFNFHFVHLTVENCKYCGYYNAAQYVLYICMIIWPAGINIRLNWIRLLRIQVCRAGGAQRVIKFYCYSNCVYTKFTCL